MAKKSCVDRKGVVMRLDESWPDAELQRVLSIVRQAMGAADAYGIGVTPECVLDPVI